MVFSAFFSPHSFDCFTPWLFYLKIERLKDFRILLLGHKNPTCGIVHCVVQWLYILNYWNLPEERQQNWLVTKFLAVWSLFS